MAEEKKGFKFPTAYTILFLLIILVAIGTWIIPAGSYDYNEDGEPIPGTYHEVERNPQRIIADGMLAPIDGMYGIQDETGAKIDIGEDGTVFIATNDGESARVAIERVEALTESAEIGRIYTGKVVRVADFGAFVEILPNVDGLVHISQLDTQRVEKVEDIVRMGDEITVMVTNIDADGKIRLSRQAVLEGWTAEEAAERDRRKGSRSGGGHRGRRGNDRRGSGKR